MSEAVSVTSSGVGQEFEFALGDELRGERATLGKTLLDVQRDLRIQASYISAIEDGNPAAFPSPNFISGYIRSYARYLSLDPDVVFRRFCEENGISSPEPAITRSDGKGEQPQVTAAGNRQAFELKYQLSEPSGRSLSDVPIAAIGSLVVLVLIVGGLGYGTWSVLQSVQRVRFAPVEELPVAETDVDSLFAAKVPGEPVPGLPEIGVPVATIELSDLYRRQELEVPIVAPRDGPIAAIDPELAEPLLVRPAKVLPLRSAAVSRKTTVPHPETSIRDLVAATLRDEEPVVANGLSGLAPPEGAGVELSAVAGEPVSVVAERAAWIRVYQDDGTIVFESILETGQSYAPPQGISPLRIWAGNSGSVYVRVGDDLHGPLGSGTKAVKDISLEPVAVAEAFELVREVPEEISGTFGPVGDDTRIR